MLRTMLTSPLDVLFQWAPTLGGECYGSSNARSAASISACLNGHPPLGVNATRQIQTGFGTRRSGFNGHPPLGVNATNGILNLLTVAKAGFNGHPPLGVNATSILLTQSVPGVKKFQWAPTLGGECYFLNFGQRLQHALRVSMGTHPWG